MKKLFALDLGTTKFCLASLNFSSQGNKLDIVSVPAKGMKRGMLCEPSLAHAAIHELLDAAENQLGESIKKVSVGIAGSHLKSKLISVSYPSIKHQKIDQKLLDRLKEEAELSFSEPTREALHILPFEYILDDRPPCKNPLGLSADKISANFLLIHGDRYYLKDVLKLCNDVGLQVKRFHAEPLASASVTLSEEEKEEGVCLCDIGGGTTDGIIIFEGKPQKSFTINIAGFLMTKDLAQALEMPFDKAEELKLHHKLLPYGDKSEVQDPKTLMWEYAKSKDFAERVLSARIFELCKILDKEIKPLKSLLKHGIYLTGGGSEVYGICSLMEKYLKIPVRLMKPKFKDNSESHSQMFENETKSFIYPPRYATALGLLNLDLHADNIKSFEKDPTYLTKSNYFSSLVNWFKELK